MKQLLVNKNFTKNSRYYVNGRQKIDSRFVNRFSDLQSENITLRVYPGHRNYGTNITVKKIGNEFKYTDEDLTTCNYHLNCKLPDIIALQCLDNNEYQKLTIKID